MAILVLIILFFALLFTRYLILARKKPASSHQADTVTGEALAGKLSRMIRIPTVSWSDESKTDIARFEEFQNLLEDLFPLVHQAMKRRIPDAYGMMYEWTGRDPDAEPVLFLAHYDVVPAAEEGKESWERPPFSGDIADGVVWGRGALDMKSHLAMLLEGAETLLAEGFVPERTICFAFGGDEEISGLKGANKMAEIYAAEGRRFAMVMDEGGLISSDMLNFLKGKPVALTGLAEKGFVSFKITAAGKSGHSSMPHASGTVVSHMAEGISRISRRRHPARLTAEIKGMLESFVPHVSWPLGVLFANLWLTGPLIRLIFSKTHTTDSLIRTTQAFTVARAGEQENVIPGEASCVVNHRILPGDSIEALRQRHENKLRGLNLEIKEGIHWPSNDPIVPDEGAEDGLIWVEKALAESHPEAVVSPFLMNAGTDSKHYKNLTGRIIRFSPLHMSREDIASIHGVNEKVSVENLNRGLVFFRRLYKQL